MEIKSKMKWFNRLRRRAFNDIQRSGTTANDFRVFVLDPSLPWEDEDRRAIIRADQVATICAVISNAKYLNWYHSDLLEDIVKEYGSNILQGDMEEYCAEKSKMEKRFSLENFKNLALVDTDKEYGSNTLQRDMEEYFAEKSRGQDFKCILHEGVLIVCRYHKRRTNGNGSIGLPGTDSMTM